VELVEGGEWARCPPSPWIPGGCRGAARGGLARLAGRGVGSLGREDFCDRVALIGVVGFRSLV